MKIYINLRKRIFSRTLVQKEFINKFRIRNKQIYFTYQEIWLNNLGQEYIKYTPCRTRRWDNYTYEVGDSNGFGHKLLELNKCYLID